MRYGVRINGTLMVRIGDFEFVSLSQFATYHENLSKQQV